MKKKIFYAEAGVSREILGSRDRETKELTPGEEGLTKPELARHLANILSIKSNEYVKVIMLYTRRDLPKDKRPYVVFKVVPKK